MADRHIKHDDHHRLQAQGRRPPRAMLIAPTAAFQLLTSVDHTVALMRCARDLLATIVHVDDLCDQHGMEPSRLYRDRNIVPAAESVTR